MMSAAYYWDMFMQTGAPEAYLLYKEHENNVSNHYGDRPERNEIQ